MSAIEVFRDLQPDVACIGIVLGATTDQLYSVQMAGRQQVVLARSVQGQHPSGECVIVMLEPHETIPTILGASPWRVVYTADPLTIHWADIDDATQATAWVPDVAANYLAMHERVHSITSSSDHDAAGTPFEGDILRRVGDRWSPAPAPVFEAVSGPSRRFKAMMMMGA